MSEHNGKCFCGAVEFSVSGEPVAMGFCHCESCRPARRLRDHAAEVGTARGE
jgi:hypothetical protein